MKKILIVLALVAFSSCKKETINTTNIIYTPTTLSFAQAESLSNLPLTCITQEYPNKLGQVLGSDADLKSPLELRPAFYGCFDWHSAVHGHWSLVVLLNSYPDLSNKDQIIELLESHLSTENIAVEISFFQEKHNTSFERTYGWAWLLKLAEALHESDDPRLKQLEQNLQPLTDLMVDKYVEFLPKLLYPIRGGEHNNTAFGISLALDYAKTVDNTSFSSILKKRALEYYQNDKNCPIGWEPNGYDFLSPCLEEAALMSKILEQKEFEIWLDNFFPELKNVDFSLEVAKVSDRQDGKLVHLDGLNFSRAKCMKDIAQKSDKYVHLIGLANHHIAFSLPNLVADSYEGGHWLGTFAIYAML